MDKIFGHQNFSGEIIWSYGSTSGGRVSGKKFVKGHDTLISYTKSYGHHYFNIVYLPYKEKYVREWFKYDDGGGRIYRKRWRGKGIFEKQYLDESLGEPASTVAEVQQVYANPQAYKDDRIGKQELIGYPTQKPEALIERLISASCPSGGTVADFFCGGGSTAAAAQRLGRRWIACDQSRVAIAITADRLTRQVEEGIGKILPVPDFTVEHWGVYEMRRLAETPPDQFRLFVLRAFGGVPEEKPEGIHGFKSAIPIWVGEPDQKKAVTAQNVQDFANAIRRTIRYKQDNLREGVMLAWAFRPDAVEAADRLRRLEQTDLNFIRLEQIRIDSPRFREHVSALTTDHADYENFLTFVQPPRVEVGYKRIAARTYKFDVSETVVMNAGAKIINVQWDFDYGTRFTSTAGFSFVRGNNKEPVLQAQYTFPSSGKKRVACKVQDDMGGEGTWVGEIEVN
jgi:SAM-dependent methyltransferase